MSALREMRQRRGLSMEALAQLAGTTASQINKLEKRQRRLTDEWLLKLAEALQCNPEDLIDGSGRRLPRTDHGTAEQLYVPECRLAPVDEDGPAAGMGHFQDYAVFRVDWLKALSSSSYDKLMVYIVDDDSMEPTLRSGDHILVEPTGDRMRGDGIYVIKMSSGLAIKRVVFAPTGQAVDILSDNPVYPAHDKVARSNIGLIGRVIWVGRRL
jgi:phage repressor protein C with HTH and peptisase S24 domain